MIRNRARLFVSVFGMFFISSTVATASEVSTVPAPDPKIAQLAAQWAPTLESGDVARNMASYTDDSVIAGYAGHSIYSGRTEIEGFLTQFLGDFRATDCSLKVISIEQLGDWAELRAEFRANWQPKKEGFKAEVESSRYVWVLQRQSDSSWKISRFVFFPMANSK